MGRKLGQHQVEVGMSARQSFASYGTPPPSAISYAAEPGRWFVRYGREATGSYFEAVADVVTVARLGRPSLPPFAWEGYYDYASKQPRAIPSAPQSEARPGARGGAVGQHYLRVKAVGKVLWVLNNQDVDVAFGVIHLPSSVVH